MSTEGFVDVGAVEDYPEGAMRVAEVGGRQIAVILWADAWYAMRNVCPHMGAPVCGGMTHALLSADGPVAEARLVADRSRPVLMCPWHRWEFDLTTGRSTLGRERIRMYPVAVEDGRVLVDAA